MSALASLLLEKNLSVSGVDRKETSITRDLQKKGAKISIGDRLPLDLNGVVIYSTAIDSSHPVIKEAQEKGLPLLHRSQLLKALLREKKALLFTGSHGKTSSSGLFTWVLSDAGFSPSFVIGGILRNLEKNGGEGKGPYFVAEADESDGSFLRYLGEGGVITNVEREHLDYWKTEKALRKGVYQFSQKIQNPSLFFWCADDPVLSSFHLPGWGYGFSPHALLRLVEYKPKERCVVFSLQFKGQEYRDIELSLLGRHQALNGAAVFGLALQLGVEEECIRKAFHSFQGIKRRLELKGEKSGVIIYDDYAHHPTELHALLTALKEGGEGKRLVAIFQPHRYSRTKDLLKEFSVAFSMADLIVITDIYAAGERSLLSIDGKVFLQALKLSKGQKGVYIKKEELAKHVSYLLQPGDIVVTLGAGDITDLGSQLLEELI
jgi:UDP-N-acetylmuramate--alanine ligase